jgi:hypothetical protein
VSYIFAGDPPSRSAAPPPAAEASTARRELLIPISLFCVVAVAAYLPFLTSTYALLDDYQALITSNGTFTTSESPTMLIREGRVLYGIAMHALFTNVTTIAALWVPRLIAVTGLIALACAFTVLLRRVGQPRLSATLIGAIVMVLPPMVLWAGWANQFAVSWSCVAGLCAGMTFSRASCNTSARARGYVAAAALLTTALLTYQPGAEFFWCAVLLSVVADQGIPYARRRRNAVAAVVFFGGVCLVYVVVWRLYMITVFASLGFSDRTEIIHSWSDVVAKALWFVREPLMHAANLLVFTQSPRLAAGVTVVIVLGLVRLWRRQGVPPAEGFGAVAVFATFAYVFNLIVRTNWAPYRAQGALAAIAVLVAALAVREILRRTGRREVVWHGLLLAVLMAQIVYVRWTIAPALIAPQQQELALIRPQVASLIEQGASHVTVLMPRWSDNAAALYRYDEIGAPSSRVDWAAEPMIRVLYAEQAGSRFAGTIETVAPDVPWRPAAGTFVIDVPAAYRALRSRSPDPAAAIPAAAASPNR